MSKPKFKVGDKVRILDGSKIEDYARGWVDKDSPSVLVAKMLCLCNDEGIAKYSMKTYVGKIGTIESAEILRDGRISYRLKEYDFCWDERGLEPAGETPTFKNFTNNRIEIYREGRDVIALDKRTGEKAIAKCSPEDEFDFEVGAKLAFERLMQRQKCFNGKVVCIKAGTPLFTKGKIYKIEDGIITDNIHPISSYCIKSIDDLNNVMASRFVEIVE